MPVTVFITFQKHRTFVECGGCPIYGGIKVLDSPPLLSLCINDPYINWAITDLKRFN